jgi:large subunit ribosomal protein L35
VPKQKTHSGAAKRFKVTANGKLKRKQAFDSHILGKKTSKRKRSLEKPLIVGPSDEKRLKKLLAK